MTELTLTTHKKGVITEPGAYRMPATTYHADPAPEPSLSSSVAVTLIEKTPRHAWTKHPRLNKALADEDEAPPTRQMEIGSAAHKLLLGEGDELVIIRNDDYRKDAAKVARSEAYALGMQPILQPDYALASAMVAAAEAQLSASGFTEQFNGAHSEVVLIWKDAVGCWCRVMMDKLWIDGDRAIIFDLKTTSTDLTMDALGRRIVDGGYEMRAAFYERGLISLFPNLAGRVSYIHLWLETEEPYALLPGRIEEAGMTIGRKKAAAAIGMWELCMKTGMWPLYPPGVARIDYPAWEERKWIDRETEDETISAMINSDPFLGRGAYHLSAPSKTVVPGV